MIIHLNENCSAENWAFTTYLVQLVLLPSGLSANNLHMYRTSESQCWDFNIFQCSRDLNGFAHARLLYDIIVRHCMFFIAVHSLCIVPCSVGLLSDPCWLLFSHECLLPILYLIAANVDIWRSFCRFGSNSNNWRVLLTIANVLNLFDWLLDFFGDSFSLNMPLAYGFLVLILSRTLSCPRKVALVPRASPCTGTVNGECGLQNTL